MAFRMDWRQIARGRATTVFQAQPAIRQPDRWARRTVAATHAAAPSKARLRLLGPAPGRLHGLPQAGAETAAAWHGRSSASKALGTLAGAIRKPWIPAQLSL